MNTLNKKVHLCFCVQLSLSYVQYSCENDSALLYKTFFSGIQAEENLPLTIFTAGNFLEWQTGRRQAYTMLLNSMVSRKQIELLGSGYYQPYLPLLPASDVIGQLEMMTSALRTHFGKRPRGIFVTASAWDPALIGPFIRCGMEYCLLDYRLFPKEKEFQTYCGPFHPAIVEDKGKTITVLPYIADDPDFLTRTPEQFYEKVAATTPAMGDSLYLLFLPIQTYIQCLEKKNGHADWFSSFITLCNQSGSVIQLTHTADLMKHRQPHYPVYIPSNTVLCNMPTGHAVKQSLTLRHDAFKMYAKMMYINMLANSMKGDKARKKYALQELWKAQNAELFALEPCTLEYHTELRRIAYKKLLVAEKQTRLPGIFTEGLTRYDIDMDGFKEVLSQRTFLNMYVHHHGGKIFECDVFFTYKNYCALPVAHSGMFIDYLLSGVALQRLKTGDISALTSVFSDTDYQELEVNTIRSELKLAAASLFDSSIEQPVSLRKQYAFFSDGTQVQYILKNDSPFNLSAYFVVEIDCALEQSDTALPSLSLYDCEENQKRAFSVTGGIFNKVSWIQLEDATGKIRFTVEANEVPALITIPVYNVCKSESACTEQIICGIRMFFYWRVDLNSNYETEKLLFLKINET